MAKKIIGKLSGVFAICCLSVALVACNEDSSGGQGNNELYVTLPDQGVYFQPHQDFFLPSTTTPDATLTINPLTTFQTIDGFGYALTGGSAMHLQGMSQAARQKILQELFGTGAGQIGVSYLRVSIGASDLDPTPFSLDDMPTGETDASLTHFSMANEQAYVIPVLKQILAIAPNIKILGSTWSPPAWMKDNQSTIGGSLQPQFYSAYAQYLLKYIQGMKQQGINIDAITVQNEPLNPDNNPSMLMLAADEGVFIKNYLGPLFQQQKIKTKIVIYDHNADRPDYPISILNDPQAAQYIDGSAFHLYAGDETALSEVHDAAPAKNVYFTEQWVGAYESFAGAFPWHIQHVIIGTMNNWSRTALEWNLSSNEQLEPHTPGGCDQCLGALTIDGDNVTRNPAYYVIAHASTWVRPGSVRIASSDIQDIPSVAFRTPNGSYVVIMQNNSGQDKQIQVVLLGRSVVVKLPNQGVISLKFPEV